MDHERTYPTSRPTRITTARPPHADSPHGHQRAEPDHDLQYLQRAGSAAFTITDPNGVLTTLTYDTRQRLTSRSVGSETMAIEYWPTGLSQEDTLPDTTPALHLRQCKQADSYRGQRAEQDQYTLDLMSNRTH